MPSLEHQHPPWHQFTKEEVLRKLDIDEQGLSEQQLVTSPQYSWFQGIHWKRNHILCDGTLLILQIAFTYARPFQSLFATTAGVNPYTLIGCSKPLISISCRAEKCKRVLLFVSE